MPSKKMMDVVMHIVSRYVVKRILRYIYPVMVSNLGGKPGILDPAWKDLPGLERPRPVSSYAKNTGVNRRAPQQTLTQRDSRRKIRGSF
jgi:hypothetical protein